MLLSTFTGLPFKALHALIDLDPAMKIWNYLLLYFEQNIGLSSDKLETKGLSYA